MKSDWQSSYLAHETGYESPASVRYKSKWLFVGQIETGWVNTAQMRLDCIRSLVNSVSTVCDVPFHRWAGRYIGYAFRKGAFGPPVAALNRTIRTLASEQKPDVVWIDKGMWVFPSTVRRLQTDLGCTVVHYTPDPAFTTHRSRHFTRSVPYYDLLLTTKRYELAMYRKCGAKRTECLYPTFDSRLHRPVDLSPDDKKRFACDAVFIGTYGPGRERFLLPLAEAGVSLAIWGSGWNQCREPKLKASIRNATITGEDYVKALRATKIGLGILSTLHPDQATTRSAEIPAIGTFLLAQRTDEHQEMFVEGKEAEFFSDEEELLRKAKCYLLNDDLRKEIAEWGRLRVITNKCDVRIQMNSIVKMVETLRSNHRDQTPQ